MGDITMAMRTVSGAMAENKNAAQRWGELLRETIYGVIGYYRDLENAIKRSQQAAARQPGQLPSGFGTGLPVSDPNNPSAFDLFGRMRARGRQEAPLVGRAGGLMTIPDISSGRVSSAGGSRGGGKSAAASEAERRDQDEVRAQVDLQRIALTDLEKIYRRSMENVREEFKKTGNDVAFAIGANKANSAFAQSLPGILNKLDELERRVLKDPTESQAKLLSAQQSNRRRGVEDLGADDVKENNERLEEFDLRLAARRKEIAERLFADLRQINEDQQQEYLQSEEEAWNLVIENQKGNIDEQNRLRGEATNSMSLILNNERDRQLANIDDEKKARKESIETEVKDEETKLKLLAALDDLYKKKAEIAEADFQKRLKAIQEQYAMPVDGGDAVSGLTKRWQELKETMEGVVGMDNMLQSVGGLGIDIFTNMTSAVGSAIEAWALYGDSIGAALKKALAAELAHVAGVAAINAIYSTALGFMRLAQWDFAGATNAFISAGLWAALAGGAALAARALSGDGKDKKGSRDGQESRVSSEPKQDPSPFSRESNMAYASGERDMIQQMNGVWQLATTAIQDLQKTIKATKPGDVFINGMNQNRGAIGRQLVEDIKSNASIGRNMRAVNGGR